MPEEHLRALLEICTKEAPFTCPRGNLYRQVDGVAMGSPLGVLFANFFMGSIEKTTLQDRHPSIYGRYVDDIFIRVKDIDELLDLKLRLTTASGLNFTYEESTDGRLPFLDVLVSACNSGFKTTVYVKETNKGLCLNGNSECPERYLRSTINAYIRRALSHCSSWENLHTELERLSQILVNNGYRNNDINTAISRTLDKWYRQPAANTEEKENIKIYYKNFMSQDYRTEERIIKDIIYKNVKPTDPDTRLQLIIYYKNMKTSNLLIKNRPGQTRTPLQEDHVIYEHTCTIEGCGPQSYIGMTRTTLSRRLTCHLQDGAIKNHYRTKHRSNVTRQKLEEGTRILDKERDPQRLLYLEAIYITNSSSCINIQAQNFQVLPTLKHKTQKTAAPPPSQ